MGTDETRSDVESAAEQAERIGDLGVEQRDRAQLGIDELVTETARMANSSEALEITIVKTLKNENKWLKRGIAGALVVGMFSMFFGGLLSYRSIYKTGPAIERTQQDSEETNEILQRTIKEKDAELAAYEYILTQQALPAITYMQDRIKAGLNEDVRVVLQPGQPPFTPPTDREETSE